LQGWFASLTAGAAHGAWHANVDGVNLPAIQVKPDFDGMKFVLHCGLHFWPCWMMFPSLHLGFIALLMPGTLHGLGRQENELGSKTPCLQAIEATEGV